jgi:hypothetical protein
MVSRYFHKAIPRLPNSGPPLPRGFELTWSRIADTVKQQADGLRNAIVPGPSPQIVPDLFMLIYKSISTAAIDATLHPGVMVPLVHQIENQVNATGKFNKFEVLYTDLNPPPVMWDYKCKKCRFYGPQQMLKEGKCKVVKGDISPEGWCGVWLPPANYKKFTYPKEAVKGDW